MFVLAQFNYKYHYEISINDASNMEHQMLHAIMHSSMCVSLFLFSFFKNSKLPKYMCIYPSSVRSLQIQPLLSQEMIE